MSQLLGILLIIYAVDQFIKAFGEYKEYTFYKVSIFTIPIFIIILGLALVFKKNSIAMNKIFTNSWYPIILLVFIIFGFTTRILDILYNQNIFSIIHLFSIFSMIILLIAKSYYARIIIRTYFIVQFISGILGLLSSLILIFTRNSPPSVGRISMNLYLYAAQAVDSAAA